MAHEVFPKWIIEDGHLIIGKVSYHSELVKDASKVQAGGWYSYNSEDNSFLLYGSSSDCGYATVEEVTDAVRNGFCDAPRRVGRYNDHYYFYSIHPKLENAKKDFVAIGNHKLI